MLRSPSDSHFDRPLSEHQSAASKPMQVGWALAGAHEWIMLDFLGFTFFFFFDCTVEINTYHILT